jgi:flagellar motor switch protein FliN
MQEYKIEAVQQCLSESREEVEAAFKRALDDFGSLDLAGAQHGEWSKFHGDESIRGPGLVVKFQIEQATVLLLLPESSAVVPSWVQQPDATGESRLATLAQELEILLFPPDWSITSSEAKATGSLETDLQAFTAWEKSQFLAIPLLTDKGKSVLFIGLGQPAGSAAPAPHGTGKPTPDIGKHPTAHCESKPQSAALPGNRATRVFPLLTRSLLRIRLPLEVTLARTRKPLLELLQLCPGAIIQFDKSCEEPLDLSINGHVIARGVAVKVGDKFGLRILEMTPPPERYIVLGPRSSREDAQKR